MHCSCDGGTSLHPWVQIWCNKQKNVWHSAPIACIQQVFIINQIWLLEQPMLCKLIVKITNMRWPTFAGKLLSIAKESIVFQIINIFLHPYRFHMCRDYLATLDLKQYMSSSQTYIGQIDILGENALLLPIVIGNFDCNSLSYLIANWLPNSFEKNL